MSVRDQTALARLGAARARLIVDKPFIGVLLLHLPFEEAEWCRTIGTDAHRIYYDPGYIRNLSAGELQFALAHQALHCALGHFARRGHRLLGRWDAACDYAVNLLLVEEGLPAVAGALVDARFRGLGAEEIYPLLDAHASYRNFDTHLFAGHGAQSRGEAGDSRDASGMRGRQRSAGETTGDAPGSDTVVRLRAHRGAGSVSSRLDLPAAELARRWQGRFALAAQHARHAGRLSASWQRLLSAALEPPLPWRALLARFLAARAQEDYTFQRPPRRESDVVLPRLQSESIELHAVLDTSGSIGAAELAAFAAEIDVLKAQVRARVVVHACDRELAPEGPWTFEPWQPIVLPERLAGGGGTDFRPVFDWLERGRLRPDALVYFTDACGVFPQQAPAYPVLWLIKGNANAPWGETIRFN